ncbi:MULTISPECIES: hypothetical protein [Neobacillus]|uniref:Uncharacterized protein n=2 Tax=Neobacillus TaxID=2675232 RepID=A0A942YTW7_9BACI|nr:MULTISPECIES: hypothetical protein [Neobacillus]MBS4212564.1 hypothetical protein [Neobacillus rhizophilus]MBU8914972.1 hypothetical protein [Bacillus sp. FJAT-29953]MCH6268055.1 hypothetical protein [Neobacillus citreus]
MRVNHIIMVLIITAWPLYYLYELQLGAVSFLLLAIFFLYISLKELKIVREQIKKNEEKPKKEKIK